MRPPGEGMESVPDPMVSATVHILLRAQSPKAAARRTTLCRRPHSDREEPPLSTRGVSARDMAARVVVPFAMVALLLHLTMAASPVPQSPLAGCLALLQPFPVWEYECEGLLAGMYDLEEGTREGFAKRMAGWVLEGQESRAWELLAAAASTPGPPKRLVVARALRGASTDVIQLEKDGRGAALMSVQMPLGMRVLVCRGALTHCDGVLAALASLPWKSGPPAEVAEVKVPRAPIFGRPVVPSGCMDTYYTSGGSLSCGDTGIYWYAFPTEALALRKVEQFRSVVLEGEEPPSNLQSIHQRCRLNGVMTTCTRITFDSEDGPGFLVSGIVPRGNEFLVGFCLSPGTDVTPCSMLIRPP